MTQGVPREEDVNFYALRAKKRAEEFETNADRHRGGLLQAKLANFAGWIREDAVSPNVLSELGRIEDEETFWTAVEWYFEKADHLHILQPMTEEEIVEDIRRMREEGRPLPG